MKRTRLISDSIKTIRQKIFNKYDKYVRECSVKGGPHV